MDTKTLTVLEYPKVLERLAAFCDFSASMELARALEPTASHDLAVAWLNETTEARHLLSVQDIGVGAAHDIRPQADLAARGGVLDPQQLLDIRSTLVSCRDLRRFFDRRRESSLPTGEAWALPHLARIAEGLPETHGLVDAITRTVSDRGDVLDSASAKLAEIRRNARLAHDRLMTRLQKYVSDSRTASMLQEPIITQRDGRFVIPLRAEFKGRIKSIVHDQSSSGATLFVEPLPIVEANNQLRELQLAERDEERRILGEISALVGMHAVELKYGVENLAALDLAFAKAKYAEALRAAEPVLHAPGLRPGNEAATSEQPGSNVLRLFQARHPLLDPQTVVPIDFDPRPGTKAVVITGPNTGGKTVTLKTVALLVLMAQSGLHIPAQSGSEVACFASVFADIGDEQSIEQSLSTFSGHITNIIRILKQADARSLVVLDELGAGTDPQEGAALARAILTHLLGRGITSLIATHYPELKAFAHGTEGVENASLEFDIKTLQPTYHLTLGLPGRSNALLIAQRLGLDLQIIEGARSDISPASLRADKLLDDIRKERNRTSREREKLEKARQRLEADALQVEERLDRIEDERREIIAKARAEGELEVAVLKQNLEALRQQLREARQPLQAVREVEAALKEMEGQIAAPVERRPLVGGPASGQEGQAWTPKLGEAVTVASLHSTGLIVALGESDAEVQIGSLRVRAQLSELRAPGAQPTAEHPVSNADVHPADRRGRRPAETRESPGLEISLRGKLVEDGLDELEKYLEKAYAAGLPFARIVHGKGTGRMREAVREALRNSPYISSFEEGSEREGGSGVTIAKFAG
jgi:DNA mismatch repair protein MutS2